MEDITLKEFVDPVNWLTIVRLPLAALLWVAPGRPEWIALMLAGAALSDMADGGVAKATRKRRLARGADPETVGRSAAIGAWLDPLCDKTFVVSTLAAIYIGFEPALWMVLAIASRELILVPFALTYRLSAQLRDIFRFDFRAGLLGKAATVTQFTAVACILLEAEMLAPVVAFTALIGIAASAFYLRKAFYMARWMATNEFAYSMWLDMQKELPR